MTTFAYTLFLILAGYFVRWLQEDASQMSAFQKGYDAGRNDTQQEYEDADNQPRDKEAVSLDCFEERP